MIKQRVKRVLLKQMRKWGVRLRKNLWILIIFILLVANVIAPLQSTFANENKHHVLFLQSYDPQNSWARDISQGFFETIDNQRASILVHEEYMDTKRRRSDAHYDNFAKYFAEKYKDTEFSVIVTADNNAFNYVKEYNQEIFGNTPVVFVGLNRTESNSSLPSRYTGAYEEVNIEGTLKQISSIHPNDSKILIVTDETVTGQAVLSNVREAVDSFEGDQEIEFYMSSSLDAIDNKLDGLKRMDAVLLLLFNVDENDRNYTYNEGLDEIYKRSPAPVYGMWKFYLSEGIVGGFLTDGYEHGKVAAEYTIANLQGVKADPDILKQVEPVLYFDYKELKRFGLESIAIPNNAVMINRPTDEIRDLVPLLIGVSIMTALVTLIVALWYMNRKEHLMNDYLEEEKERLTDMLDQDLNSMVDKRTKELLEVQEHCEVLIGEHELLKEENDKLRLRINDCTKSKTEIVLRPENMEKMRIQIDLSQRLYTILLKGSLRSSIHIKEMVMEIGFSKEKIEQLANMYKDGSMKRSDFDEYLKNRKMAIQKFDDRLNLILSEIEKIHSIDHLDFEIDNSMISVSDVLKNASELAFLENSSRFIELELLIEPNLPIIKRSSYIAYSAIQLISNAITHAFKDDNKGRIRVLGKMVEDAFILEVSDNGCGMSESLLSRARDPYFTTDLEDGHLGIGLSNIEEIISDVFGGKMEIVSAPDQGTSVKLFIPGMEVDNYESKYE